MASTSNSRLDPSPMSIYEFTAKMKDNLAAFEAYWKDTWIGNSKRKNMPELNRLEWEDQFNVFCAMKDRTYKG